MFARLIEGLDQHNIRVLPSMKITLIYSRQDIPTKWESWEISHKSFGNTANANLDPRNEMLMMLAHKYKTLTQMVSDPHAETL